MATKEHIGNGRTKKHLFNMLSLRATVVIQNTHTYCLGVGGQGLGQLRWSVPGWQGDWCLGQMEVMCKKVNVVVVAGPS